MRYVQISQHSVYGASKFYNHETGAYTCRGVVFGINRVEDLDGLKIMYKLFDGLPDNGVDFGCILCPIIDGNICAPVMANYDSSG